MTKAAVVFVICYFVSLYILLWLHVCFCCVRFSFSVISQDTGWEHCLQNGLFCVGWGVKPQLSQSINCRSHVAGLFRLQEFSDRERQLEEEKLLINEHADQLKESLKVWESLILL